MGIQGLLFYAGCLGSCFAGAAAPVITEQPQDFTSDLGAGIQLGVTAACDAPMVFIWQFQPLDFSSEFRDIMDDDGGRIIGAFSNSPPGTHTRVLDIAPASLFDVGYYRAKIQCAGEEPVYSAAARVWLYDDYVELPDTYLWRVYEHAPLVRLQLSVPWGTGPRSYQWNVDRRDGNGRVPVGEEVPFGREPYTIRLDLTGIALTDAGFYNLELRDARPDVLTLPEDIEVQVFPHLDHVQLLGGAATFRVGENGALHLGATFEGGIAPYAVEWLKREGAEFSVIGAEYPQASPATFTIEAMQPAGTGEYAVRVSDAGTDSVLSGAVVIEVGDGGVCDSGFVHRADADGSNEISLEELLRVIQLYNAGGYGCDASEPDGLSPNTAGHACCPHDADYRGGADWSIDILELLRVIQFFNMGGYSRDTETATEDGFRPGDQQ